MHSATLGTLSGKLLWSSHILTHQNTELRKDIHSLIEELWNYAYQSQVNSGFIKEFQGTILGINAKSFTL